MHVLTEALGKTNLIHSHQNPSNGAGARRASENLSKRVHLPKCGVGHTAVYDCPNTPNCTLKRINLYYVNQTSIQVLMASHIPMGESRRGGALTLPVSAPSQARHTSPKIQQSNPKYFPQKNENTGPRQTCKKCSVLFLIAKNGK